RRLGAHHGADIRSGGAHPYRQGQARGGQAFPTVGTLCGLWRCLRDAWTTPARWPRYHLGSYYAAPASSSPDGEMIVQAAHDKIAGIGVDLLKVDRIERVYARYGAKFVSRILGLEETEKFQQRHQRDPKRGIRFLATRFAAK